MASDVFADVSDFGATGDGVTDDRLAIQAAIDDVVTKGGGTVFFPRPTDHFRVNQYQDGEANNLFYGALWVAGIGDVNTDPSGTRLVSVALIGEYPGVRLAFYHTDGSTFADNFRVLNDGINIFRGYGISALTDNFADPFPSFYMGSLIIDGTAPGTQDNQFANVASGGAGWDLTHKAIGISGQNDKVRLVDCEFINWRGEVLFSGGKEMNEFHLDRCKVGSSNGNGVNILSSKKNYFIKSTIFDCANDAFELTSQGRITIDDCIIKDVLHCIIGHSSQPPPIGSTPYDEDRILVRGTEFIDIEEAGLHVIGSNVHIHDNVFHECGGTGSGCLKIELAVDGASLWQSDKFMVNIHHNRIQVKDITIAQAIRVWENTPQPAGSIVIDNNFLDIVPGGTGVITNAISLEMSGDGVNTVVRDNNFMAALRLVESGAQDFTEVTLIPCLRDNLLPNSDGSYNSPPERYVPGPFSDATPDVQLVGRVQLQSTDFATVPVIDPTKYIKGAHIQMQGGGAAGAVLLPMDGTHWRMVADRYLYPGIEIVVEFQDGQFHEIEYKDFRVAQKTTITLPSIGTMEAEAFTFIEFNMSTPGTITDHKGFGRGREFWLVDLTGNTTLENNARLDVGGSDLPMVANTYYQAFETPDGVLRVN